MSKKFAQRSYEKELLDQENIPFEDIKTTLKELHFINTYLGGYNASRYGLNKLADRKRMKIADVGCGGGDNMIQIIKWCDQRGIDVEVVGIDMKAECIQYAESRTQSFSNVRFITSDYRMVNEHFDIIHSCLFTHHLDDEQLKEHLTWAKSHSRLGVIVNDLHRNPLAYYSIKWLTKLFSKSYLVKNDACLSVLRSFRAYEWHKHSEGAGWKYCKVHWNWAFRYTTILKNE